MTDEEKEQCKFCKEHCGEVYHFNLAKINLYLEKENEALKQALAEGKPKWHDLRKDPDDLPKDTGEFITNIGYLTYDMDGSGRFFWHTPICDACDYLDEVEADEVIAWCELPKFEE